MRGLSVETFLAATATLISLAFALSTTERWMQGRARHHGAWSIAFGSMTVAALALAVGSGTGWTRLSYAVFYLFGGIVAVPVLALGTLYLLTDRGRTDRIAVGVAGLCAFAAGVVTMAEPVAPIPVDELPRGAEVMPVLPRVLTAACSGIGAGVIVIGALWSAVVLLRGRTVRSGPLRAGRLAASNLAIAAGAIVLSASGSLNARLGASTAFAVTLVIGLALIFAGFLATNVGAPRRVDAEPFRWHVAPPPSGDATTGSVLNRAGVS